MKKVVLAVVSLGFLFIARLAFSGIDYTDYRQEEWHHQHLGSENRDRERDKQRESERERKYQHQNRDVRDKTVRTLDHINSYPEKYIP